MSATPIFDVLVIGSGITGLSTLVHLKGRGISRVALAADPVAPPASYHAPGVLTGGQLDNFTRISHRHGPDIARALWAFGDAAFDALLAWSKGQGVSVHAGRRLRLVTSAAEQREVEVAVAELHAAGFRDVKLTPPEGAPGGRAAFGARVLAVQDDGPRGGIVDITALTAALTQETAAVPRVGRVRNVRRIQGHLEVELEDGQRLRAEFAVLAAHLGIKALLPDFADAFVSYADQWGVWAREPLAVRAALPRGTVFTATHANEWGAALDGQVIYGGARYLRPLGGMEATSAAVEEKITQHLGDLAEKTLPGTSQTPVLSTGAGLDIRPCDELPVIGPMFGESRLLISTGYMGMGVTLGFHGGACLAQLIATGTAPALPRSLWPERLRTLEA